jgi:methanogen homocitrate synthase
MGTPLQPNGNHITRHVILHDVTLREGEQAASVAFSAEDKAEIALELSAIGIPQIQIGYAGEDKQALEMIRRAGIKSLLTTLVPLFTEDWKARIDSAVDSGVDIVLGLFRSSDRQLELLGFTRQTALARVRDGLEYARRAGALVGFNSSFTTLADPAFLRQLYSTAQAAGASRLGLADSTGVGTPESITALVGLVRRAASGLPISVHVHNDFGLAVGNAIRAVQAGASIVDVSVLGLGERAGNVPTEELAMALEQLYGVSTGLRLERLYSLAQTVAALGGVPIPFNKPVVGEDAFTQKLEMHVSVTEQDPDLHEPFDPVRVGQRRLLKLGKGSGPIAVRAKLQELGLSVADDQMPQLVTWVNSRGMRCKRAVTEAELAGAVRLITEDGNLPWT